MMPEKKEPATPAPVEQNTGISTTTADQVQDPANVVNINKDKLKNVDDQAIIDACKGMEDIDEQRSGLNEEAAGIRGKLKGLGVPTASFNAAYARYKKSEAKRLEQDAGYAKCCKAMGVEYQTDLWND